MHNALDPHKIHQLPLPKTVSTSGPTHPSNSGAIKLMLSNKLSPGDMVVSTAAIRDLHLSHPGKFITDIDCPCPQIFENNPYITKLDRNDPTVKFMQMDYNLIHQCNTSAFHFIHGYIQDLESKLSIKIKPTKFKPDLHISDVEKSWISQVQEITGTDDKFWIINSGGKKDYTAKLWSHARYQQVVTAMPHITFVQVGEFSNPSHIHTPLVGDNVINLLDKTDIRQLMRLVYHSAGCIGGVSFLMHLAAGIETKPGYPQARPCVVVAGAREPQQWEAYPNHQYLHRASCLPCSGHLGGGCWKSRTVKLHDGDKQDSSLCELPVDDGNGQFIPKCMDMITVSDVVNSINNYMQYWEYKK